MEGKKKCLNVTTDPAGNAIFDDHAVAPAQLPVEEVLVDPGELVVVRVVVVVVVPPPPGAPTGKDPERT
jgi:hypothetical protein